MGLFDKLRRKKPGFVIETSVGEDAVAGAGILALEGNSEATDEAVPALEKALAYLIDDEGCTRIIVECPKLSWITVDALGTILQEQDRLKEAGGDIVFVGASRDVKAFMEEAGLAKRVRFFESLDEVTEKFAKGERSKKPVSRTRGALATEQVGGVTVITLKGAVDATALGATLDELIAKKARILLDASWLANAGPELLAGLIKHGTEAQAKGARLALVPSEPVRMIATMLRVDAFVPLHETRAAGLKALGS